MENNLIYIDESTNRTIATDYALEKRFYLIDRINTKNESIIYNYYISDNGKKLLYKII